MCMHCAHTCMHVKHDKHGCLHGGGHLQFPNMFILVFHACTCMHMHVHMSRDTPMPPDAPNPSAPPQICREPKSPKVYKSWTNWDNSILFEKSLPRTFLNSSRLTLMTLDTPPIYLPRPPEAEEAEILKNAIKCERIEIIELRLKICDPWALLHTYRLDLTLLCFGPKKVHVFHSCDSLDKKFPVFALDPTRPCLDWQLSRFLTSQLINDPFKFDLKWRPKCKIWLKSQFAKEPSTVEIFEMYSGML